MDNIWTGRKMSREKKKRRQANKVNKTTKDYAYNETYYIYPQHIVYLQ
jgi:hypothetical protein